MNEEEQTLGDALKGMFQKNGLSGEVAIYEVIENWEALVGKNVAAQTERVWFKSGTLFIKVPLPVWRQQLYLNRMKIKALINEKVGFEAVSQVKII
jgi:predicted nucleic acid-binding Zn ribbon protein